MDNLEFNDDKDSRYNYSKIDGKNIRSLECSDLKMRKHNLDRCPRCEANVKNKFLYCKKCGLNLEEIYNGNRKYNINNQVDFKNMLRYINFKDSLKVATLSIIIIFIMSIIINIGLDLNSENGESIISPLYILLAFNLGSVSIYSSSMVGIGVGEIDFGLIILTTIPAIALLISNLIINKKNINDYKDLVNSSLGVGICYGTILGIIALVSKMDIEYSKGLMGYGYMLQLKYSFIGTVLKGFILGFIFTYISLFKKKYEDENMYIGVFKRAINMITLCYISILFILIIIFISDKGYLYNFGISRYTSIMEILASLSQLALCLFGFGNLIPFSMGEREYSILSILNPNSSIITTLVLISMIFLCMLIIFIESCKVESKYKREKGIKPILVLCGFYSLIIGILSIISTISINGNMDIFREFSYIPYIKMGLGVISSVIISFIFSLFVSTIGYKLNIFND